MNYDQIRDVVEGAYRNPNEKAGKLLRKSFEDWVDSLNSGEFANVKIHIEALAKAGKDSEIRVYVKTAP